MTARENSDETAGEDRLPHEGGGGDEISRARRDLELFAHATSHDLQEPLRIVSSFLRLLEQRYSDVIDERGKSYIAHALEGTQRMDALLGDLVQYSRVTTRGKPFTTTDTEAALARAIAFSEKQVLASRATIDHSPLQPVFADGSQLWKVFYCLLDNAIKFRGGAAPIIRITQEYRPSEWVFSVSDNGIGFAAEYEERIFDIFQRLHTREEYPGTGMGLALCRRIVDRHGGRMWARSQPSLGSSFFFTIPVRDGTPT